MSIEVKITGQKGIDSSVSEAHVSSFKTANGIHTGLEVLTHRFIETEPSTKFFTNDTVGIAMNQDVSFGGTPEVIHSGSLTEWVGTAIAGAWNFTDSDRISITSANNNDAADFAEENTLTIDMSGFTALTGNLNLDTYNDINYDSCWRT